MTENFEKLITITPWKTIYKNETTGPPMSSPASIGTLTQQHPKAYPDRSNPSCTNTFTSGYL